MTLRMSNQILTLFNDLQWFLYIELLIKTSLTFMGLGLNLNVGEQQAFINISAGLPNL